LEVANRGGYNHLSLGAPVVIADGIYGNDSIMVEAGELLGKVAIASAIYDAKSMIVLTHVKGHIQAVFGGAIKIYQWVVFPHNLGMVHGRMVEAKLHFCMATL